VTDLSILKSHGIRVRARPKSPPIKDSVQAVNTKLKTAAGDVDMYIHPRCKGLIESLERTRWVDHNPNSLTIDKTDGLEHYSDGVRYSVEYLYPVRSGGRRTSRGFDF